MISLVFSTFFLTIFIVKKSDHRKEDTNIEESVVEDKPESIEEKSTFDSVVEAISSEEMKSNLTYLASDELEGRMSGKKGNVVAAEYIKKKYEEYGLQTMYDKFRIKRMNPGPHKESGDNYTQNIYAWIEGTDPVLKNEIVVIGAHMDHIGYGPSMSRASNRRQVHNGADDNASGTVALLEIAKSFSKLKSEVKRTVVFQSYSAEEMGLIGSRFYCENPKFPKDSPAISKHVFMLNMDMVGYLGKGDYTVAWDNNESSIDVSKYIDDLNKTYSFANKITFRSGGGSDHASFYNKKVPIAFLHTGLHPYYHTPDDDVERINFDGLQKVAKYGFELSWKIVQSEKSPQFNMASFKDLPYTHDHGHPEMPFHSYHQEEENE